MSKYVKFSQEQILAASRVDLAEFLKSQGETLEKSGREWRWKNHTSVTIKGNMWHQHKYAEGGNSIQFLQRFYNLDFPDAVIMLLNFVDLDMTIDNTTIEEAPKEFKHPIRNDNMKQMFGYLLKSRFIGYNILKSFVSKKLIFEDKYHNVIFAGYDEQGNLKHAHRKNTKQNGYGRNVEGSLPEYSFHYIGNSGKIYVFEAPIDMLSYITLHPDGWEQHTYIANCGLSMIPLNHYLETHKEIAEINLCLDNDPAGDEGTSKFKDILQGNGYIVNVLTSQYKDWNEDLKALNGVKPKCAVENPKYHEYEQILDTLNGIYQTLEKSQIDFKNLMQSYSEFLYVLEDPLKKELLNERLNDIAVRAYSLFCKTYESQIGSSDCVSDLKGYLQSSYRTYKDRSQLTKMNNNIKTIMNDLKINYHKQNGNYLNAEIASTYLELTEECAKASRWLLSESMQKTEEKIDIRIPESKNLLEHRDFSMQMG